MKQVFQLFSGKKIHSAVISFLKQGLTASLLAQATAIGIFLGTIPVPGVSTILCFIVSSRLKVNLAVLQFVNYIMFPVQIFLFLPFYSLSGKISGKPIMKEIPEIMTQIFSSNWQHAGTEALSYVLIAIVLWILTMAPVSYMAYFMLKPVYLRIQNGIKKNFG